MVQCHQVPSGGSVTVVTGGSVSTPTTAPPTIRCSSTNQSVDCVGTIKSLGVHTYPNATIAIIGQYAYDKMIELGFNINGTCATIKVNGVDHQGVWFNDTSHFCAHVIAP